MAGIEPASERIDPRTSTSLVCFLGHRHPVKQTKARGDYPLGPESPLSCTPRHGARHFNFVTSALLPVEERSRQA